MAIFSLVVAPSIKRIQHQNTWAVVVYQIEPMLFHNDWDTTNVQWANKKLYSEPWLHTTATRMVKTATMFDQATKASTQATKHATSIHGVLRASPSGPDWAVKLQ